MPLYNIHTAMGTVDIADRVSDPWVVIDPKSGLKEP